MYKQKYLKYKQKYIKLSEIAGGGKTMKKEESSLNTFYIYTRKNPDDEDVIIEGMWETTNDYPIEGESMILREKKYDMAKIAPGVEGADDAIQSSLNSFLKNDISFDEKKEYIVLDWHNVLCLNSLDHIKFSYKDDKNRPLKNLFECEYKDFKKTVLGSNGSKEIVGSEYEYNTLRNFQIYYDNYGEELLDTIRSETKSEETGGEVLIEKQHKEHLALQKDFEGRQALHIALLRLESFSNLGLHPIIVSWIGPSGENKNQHIVTFQRDIKENNRFNKYPIILWQAKGREPYYKQRIADSLGAIAQIDDDMQHIQEYTKGEGESKTSGSGEASSTDLIGPIKILYLEQPDCEGLKSKNGFNEFFMLKANEDNDKIKQVYKYSKQMKQKMYNKMINFIDKYEFYYINKWDNVILLLQSKLKSKTKSDPIHGKLVGLKNQLRHNEKKLKEQTDPVQIETITEKIAELQKEINQLQVIIAAKN